LQEGLWDCTNTLEYNQYFYDFCRTVFEYQYTKIKVELSDSIIQWLYEHSGGIVSVVISLLHDAQEIAILNGKEKLSIDTLNEAYKKRLSLLHNYIEPTIKRKSQTATTKKTVNSYTKAVEKSVIDETTISGLVLKAKTECADIVQVLKKHIQVVEVGI